VCVQRVLFGQRGSKKDDGRDTCPGCEFSHHLSIDKRCFGYRIPLAFVFLEDLFDILNFIGVDRVDPISQYDRVLHGIQCSSSSSWMNLVMRGFDGIKFLY